MPNSSYDFKEDLLQEKSENISYVIKHIPSKMVDIFKQNWTSVKTHQYEGRKSNHRFYNIRLAGQPNDFSIDISFKQNIPQTTTSIQNQFCE